MGAASTRAADAAPGCARCRAGTRRARFAHRAPNRDRPPTAGQHDDNCLEQRETPSTAAASAPHTVLTRAPESRNCGLAARCSRRPRARLAESPKRRLATLCWRRRRCCLCPRSDSPLCDGRVLGVLLGVVQAAGRSPRQFAPPGERVLQPWLRADAST